MSAVPESVRTGVARSAIRFSTVNSATDNKPQTREATFSEFAEFVRSRGKTISLTREQFTALPDTQRKIIKNGPAVVLAVFDPERAPLSKSGGWRDEAHVADVSGATFDLDYGNPDIDAVANSFDGLAAVIHESASSRPDARKLRVYVPYQQPVGIPTHYAAWAALSKRLRPEWLDGTLGRDPGRLCYLPPSFNGGECGEFRLIDGEPFDAASAGAIRPAREADAEPPKPRVDVQTELTKVATGEKYHEALLRVTASMARARNTFEQIDAACRAVMEGARPSDPAKIGRWQREWDDLPRTIRTALDKYGPKGDAAPPDDRFPPIDQLAQDGEPGSGGAHAHHEDQIDYRKLRFRPLHELLDHPTQVEWLLRGILERRVITLVAGKRGSFKSFVLLHWLLTLAVRGVPVFLVSAEGAGLSRRIEAWLKVHAPDADPTKVTLFVHEQRVNFNDPAGLSAVRAAIEASGMAPEVVAIDTFSKNSGGLDENSNSEVKAFIGGLDAGLRIPLDTSVILVAHTGHGDQTRVRGASALEADTDAALIVNRPGVERVVTVERNRFKDAPELPPLVYNAEEVDLDRFDDDGQRVTSLVMREADDQTRHAVVSKAPIGKAQREILRALRNRQSEAAGPLIWSLEDMRRIGRDLGQHKSTARGAVDGLVCNGFLTPTVGGHRLADGAA